jgi:hypothetical protein
MSFWVIQNQELGFKNPHEPDCRLEPFAAGKCRHLRGSDQPTAQIAKSQPARFHDATDDLVGVDVGIFGVKHGDVDGHFNFEMVEEVRRRRQRHREVER